MSGCDKEDSGVFIYSPDVEIRFVNKNGKVLHFDKDGKISFHDFVELGPTLSENDGKGINSLEENPMEILSITDESGSPVGLYHFYYNGGFSFYFEMGGGYTFGKKRNMYTS